MHPKTNIKLIAPKGGYRYLIRLVKPTKVNGIDDIIINKTEILYGILKE